MQQSGNRMREIWADPEYKQRVSKAISDGWKRRREERERLEALKPKPEPYRVPDLPGEEWRDIKGFEGQYAVSNLGRVKSLERTLPHKTHGTWHIRERLLRQGLGGPGPRKYCLVSLHVGGGKMICLRVHRLVAEAFLPMIDGKNQVNHIDGNKLNNSADNLEWCTGRENVEHAWKAGLCENIVTCKSRAVQNVETGETFESIATAERVCGNRNGAIGHAVRKGSRAFGYYWQYVEGDNA